MITKKELLEKVNSLEFDVGWLQKSITNTNNRAGLATVKQLQCAAKGHNFVFEKADEKYVWVDAFSFKAISNTRNDYQFKCTNCDLTITKTINELTTIEKKALKDLGILEEEKENGESPTTEN